MDRETLMEEPVGFRRFKSFVNNARDYPSLPAADNLIQAAELMKEMAEALEMIRASEQKKGTVGQYLFAWKVLSKFREWK